MDQDIRLITLGVEDLGRSRDFYTNGLGWSPILDLDEVVFYQAGFGLALALFPLEDFGKDAGHPITPGSAFSLAHNVETENIVDEVVEQARSAGATILKEPQRADFGGYHAYFADPDGHRWEVAHNPGLRVSTDGSVVFGS